jgi:hypothetical protein
VEQDIFLSWLDSDDGMRVLWGFIDNIFLQSSYEALAVSWTIIVYHKRLLLEDLAQEVQSFPPDIQTIVDLNPITEFTTRFATIKLMLITMPF